MDDTTDPGLSKRLTWLYWVCCRKKYKDLEDR